MEDDNTNDTMIAKGGNRQKGPTADNTDGTDDASRPVPPEMNCDSDSENCEMPEPPEGFDGEMPTDIKEGGFMGGEFPGQIANRDTDAILHPMAYLAIGGGSVILGILVSYALFSRFFHLKPGQTFSTLSKFIWFSVVAVVLAVGLCALGYFIPVWCS